MGIADGKHALVVGVANEKSLAWSIAQGAALMAGRASDDPQRSYPGNRPSSTVLLDRLDARALGALLAFYEHRTFANAVLLGINPFDQFGVELGKQIAQQIADGGDQQRLDASTRGLINSDPEQPGQREAGRAFSFVRDVRPGRSGVEGWRRADGRATIPA